jgi:hypothetical protein
MFALLSTLGTALRDAGSPGGRMKQVPSFGHTLKSVGLGHGCEAAAAVLDATCHCLALHCSHGHLGSGAEASFIMRT